MNTTNDISHIRLCIVSILSVFAEIPEVPNLIKHLLVFMAESKQG